MSDLSIRTEHRAGRITLTRPQALNALTHEMSLAIEAALDGWAHDDHVDLVVLDAEGDRAFCAGGDIAGIYHAGRAGDFDAPRAFWRDEYRLNAKIAHYPKPFVALMQGFTMGGGVGLGCHAAHRIVCETTQVAMPECGIGLVPDVGGSLLLARAPGHRGEYLGLTGARMNAADAIAMGFADHHVPCADWAGLIDRLVRTGDVTAIPEHVTAPEPGRLPEDPALEQAFGLADLHAILDRLSAAGTEACRKAEAMIERGSPLSAATTLELIRRARKAGTIEAALELEYRGTWRALEHGDLLEGVRAQIIDKDRAPLWKHGDPRSVTADEVARMLAPLGDNRLNLGRQSMKIAFIGLGNMGGPMAENLAKAGHEVIGNDVAPVTPAGVRMVDTPEEAVTGAEVVITMLPNGQILRDLARRIIPAMAPDTVFLDCSTVDVDSARTVGDAAMAAGLLPLDAPVSGGTGGAQAGTLTFMVGGDETGFARAKPLFEIMGQKAVHCGPSGNGQAAKICNNMILGVTMIATCEAFALADKLGLDRQAMYDVVSTSSGQSWSLTTYCPAPGVGPKSPSDNGYKPGFAADLMLKDLRLSQQAAESADADTPLGLAACKLYEAFVEAEDGKGRDFSAMLPRFEARGRS